MDLNILNNDQHVAKIKVIGVGGCGNNLVNYMSMRETCGVSFVAVNTDSQALAKMNERVECVQIGNASTKGLGAGGKPEVARAAAEAENERLTEIISGVDMLFVVAGMGKGTGTGASPVVAEIARSMNVLTVALVVMPFEFENRREQASGGLAELSKQVDSLIVAPNEKLRDALGADAGMKEAHVAANDLLYNAVCGISDIINKPGDINVDFNDVRSAMCGKGKAVIGSASATGASRAVDAAEAALHSELMESVDLAGASHILINISSSDFKLSELEGVVEVIKEHTKDLRGNITPGLSYDEEMGEEIRVTVIVTGVSEMYQPKILENPSSNDSIAGDFFQTGRRQHKNQQAAGGDKQHKTPAILRVQTN